MSDLTPLQHHLGNWADSTFKRSTPNSIISHLEDEVRELSVAVQIGKVDDIKAEAADCLLLLLHLAHKLDFSLFDAADAKFDVIRKRKWGTPDSRGVVRHVGGGS